MVVRAVVALVAPPAEEAVALARGAVAVLCTTVRLEVFAIELVAVAVAGLAAEVAEGRFGYTEDLSS